MDKEDIMWNIKPCECGCEAFIRYVDADNGGYIMLVCNECGNDRRGYFSDD